VKALVVCGVLLSGCAASVILPRGPGLIFEDSSGPLEWRPDVLSASREVHGESCRNAIGLPLFLFGGWDLVGWSDAGYRDAVAKAQAQAPGATLTDVRADLHSTTILIWRQQCLEVTAAAR
jgi:hypothetical protein